MISFIKIHFRATMDIKYNNANANKLSYRFINFFKILFNLTFTELLLILGTYLETIRTIK